VQDDKERLEELRKLYPGLTDKELEEVDRRLAAYVALAIRVFERLESEAETKNGHPRSDSSAGVV
jgi:hypothetical protein